MSRVIRLSFTEQINVQTIHGFIETLERCNEENPDCMEIEIQMSTPGGDVELAIELYNFLKSLKCKITTINTSYVNSAGIIVYLAGDERICMPCSSFFLHTVSKKMNGEYDVAMLECELKELKTNTTKIVTLLEDTTLKKKNIWHRMMKAGTILPAEKAVEMGLALNLVSY